MDASRGSSRDASRGRSKDASHGCIRDTSLGDSEDACHGANDAKYASLYSDGNDIHRNIIESRIQATITKLFKVFLVVK